MILTETHYISKKHPLHNECDILCLVSKNLYNSSLYNIRQFYLKYNTFIDGTYLDKNNQEHNNWIFSLTYIYHKMKDTHEYRTYTHNEYKGLKVNTKVLRQTQRQVSRDISNYLKAAKEYHKNPSKFNGLPQLPYYKKKTGRTVTTFPKNAISFRKKKGYIHLGGTNIFINSYKATQENIKEVKIVPCPIGYNIIISYEVVDITQVTGHTKYAGIDLGLNNLATLTSNDTNFKPFIVNGKPLKSINQYFNKKKANLFSKLPKGIYFSKKLGNLYIKRHHKIKDYMHKASDYIVCQLIQSGITCLIVGSNKNWKTSINIGKKNNQNFVSIPFYKFKHMLKYKCEMAGIEYIETEESYTSKCSFLDLEEICKHDSYIGNRVKRGLFKSGTKVINADMNGSYNILRKVVGNDIFMYQNMSDLIEDYAVNPSRVNFT